MSCHDGTQANIPLNLTAGASHAALVGPDMVATCSSSNTKRVVAGNVSGSGLIDKLMGTSCGTRMPENAPPLTAGELV